MSIEKTETGWIIYCEGTSCEETLIVTGDNICEIKNKYKWRDIKITTGYDENDFPVLGYIKNFCPKCFATLKLKKDEYVY
jgi:hypothetical protein